MNAFHDNAEYHKKENIELCNIEKRARSGVVEAIKTYGFGNRKLLARSINVPSKRSKDFSNYEALIARNRLLKMAIS